MSRMFHCTILGGRSLRDARGLTKCSHSALGRAHSRLLHRNCRGTGVQLWRSSCGPHARHTSSIERYFGDRVIACVLTSAPYVCPRRGALARPIVLKAFVMTLLSEPGGCRCPSCLHPRTSSCHALQWTSMPDGMDSPCDGCGIGLLNGHIRCD